MNLDTLVKWASESAGFSAVPADSCASYGGERLVRRVAISINANTGDLLLAKQLGCDGYLIHHPLTGAASRDFHLVLDRMEELMREHGVESEAARTAVTPLRTRVRFRDHASDWSALETAAEYIDLPLANIHLPADEFGRRRMVEAVKTVTPDSSLGDLQCALRAIPELAHTANEMIVVSGAPDRPIGRVAIMHGGGTNGGAAVANALFNAGVGTVVYIHIAGEDTPGLIERHQGHVLVTGHFASDAIGLNMLMAAAEKRFGVEFVPMGGMLPFANCRRD